MVPVPVKKIGQKQFSPTNKTAASEGGGYN